MAGEEAPGPNTGRWATLLGGSAAILAGLAQAVLAYYTVVGFRIDWMTFQRRPTVEPAVAGLGTGLSIFLLTLVVGMVSGAIAWSLANRGRLRGDPEAIEREEPAGWSEYAFKAAAGTAASIALIAGLVGFLLAETSTGGLDGQTFFVFQVAVALLAGALGAAVVSRRVADAHASDVLRAEAPGGNMVSRIQLWSAENAIAVVVVTLLVVAGTGYGITKITTDVDVADLLPRGNGNTTAAQNVSREFKSTFTQQVTLQFREAPAQCQQDARRVLGTQRASEIDCGNISAEPYVRGMEELYQRILEDEDNPITYTIGLNSFYKLINWTIGDGVNGGQNAPPGAFSLPPTARSVQGQADPTGASGASRYEMVDRGVWTAIPDTITPIIDPSFDQTASLYLVPTTYDGSSPRIGHEMLEFRDNYVQAVEDGETTWRIWGEENPPIFTVDIPVANAHQSDLAREDFGTLFPLIFAVIVVALYFNFRNFTAIGITGSTLLNAAVITYGGMGHLGIPLNTLNLTVLPLILGNGIDYAIHQTTEFAHFKREGLTDEEALRKSGGLAGFAMFIATATTVSGLLVMTVSPSLLMAQVGLLAAIAMVSVYLLTISFMPALLALSPHSDGLGDGFEPSRLTTKLARLVSKNRVAVVFLVAMLSAAAAVGLGHLTIEEFGEPANNFPEDDPLRIEHEEGLRGFYDIEEGGTELKTNIIVFQGDNTDIQSHRYMRALQDAMSTKESLNLNTSRTVPFLLENWLTVKDGLAGAGEDTAREQATTCTLPPPPGPSPPTRDCSLEQVSYYPQTREEIISELDASFRSPLSTFGSLFIDHPNYNISIMSIATTTGDFQNAEAAWDDIWAAYDETETRKPHDLEVGFVGNTALNYLFVNEELPWLSYLGYASATTLLLLAAIFTKRFRAVLAVGSILGFTSLWWLGVLPAFDIGLAITLMLPAVFITSIGSDYAIHMTWNMIRNPDRAEVYGVVGKAVLFSAITDIGAFAIFTQTQNVAAAEAMTATVIAIAVMFVATMLVMPVLYPLGDEEGQEGNPEPGGDGKGARGRQATAGT